MALFVSKAYSFECKMTMTEEEKGTGNLLLVQYLSIINAQYVLVPEMVTPRLQYALYKRYVSYYIVEGTVQLHEAIQFLQLAMICCGQQLPGVTGPLVS